MAGVKEGFKVIKAVRGLSKFPKAKPKSSPAERLVRSEQSKTARETGSQVQRRQTLRKIDELKKQESTGLITAGERERGINSMSNFSRESTKKRKTGRNKSTKRK